MNNCDCPRATGIIHYDTCPMHDPNACPMCDTRNHGSQDVQDKIAEATKPLREALRFYGNKDNHAPISMAGSTIYTDDGKKARQVLEETEGNGPQRYSEK